MRKLTFTLVALVMGFMLTSCGDSLKESVIKDVDAYFTKAEQTLASIETSEEFVDFALTMNDRSELMDQLNESYGDRTISDEDWNAIESYIEERATAYNQAEAAKCAEFLTPAIDRFEAIVNQMYPQYQEGTPFDEETLNEFLDAYFGVTAFTDCENVYPELSDRVDAILEKEDEMSPVIVARMDELWPDEE